MNDATRAQDRPVTYLIILRHVLVAQDIAMTVAEFAPDAEIITTASPDQALLQVQTVERLAMVFIGQGPSAFRGSTLAEEIARRGGRVVLMGEEAELAGEAAGFSVLMRPFTTESIMGHLTGLASPEL